MLHFHSETQKQKKMAFPYDVKLVRSFRRDEQVKLGCAGILGCFFVSVVFLALLKPYLISSLPISNLQIPVRSGLTLLRIEDTSTRQQGESQSLVLQSKLVCNVTDPKTDHCEMTGDVRVHGNSSEVFLVSSPMDAKAGNASLEIKPYPRKKDPGAMANVNKLTLKLLKGNLFHDFSDVLVPLFLTTRHFHGEVQFVITDYKSWWVNRYSAVLKQLSNYGIIDFDRDNRTHCFQAAHVGLKFHKELSIDSTRTPQGYSMHDFSKFLRSSYSLQRETAIKVNDGSNKKPRLLIISRKRSRSFTNEGEIGELARSLGFEVIVAEANLSTDFSKFLHIVNSCDVLMGVHGAGLTNLVFLPTNAVVIQIIPLGRLGSFGRADFGVPAIDMKLRYLEYKIKENESSLIEHYPLNHPVFRNPISIHRRGWTAIKSVYLDNQNVKLDVVRFRSTLLEALELLRR
ncbi:alpha-1,3-arabinosyltransferase XAT3-like isoform X2 [Aristolochia californica]|uniref:alpha-1,3-arabinosyltransferase XAT3-like isoform X2 n=1 Tax=Aristolochia californica TaxID=171875 RepID=UPI0035D701B1